WTRRPPSSASTRRRCTASANVTKASYEGGVMTLRQRLALTLAPSLLLLAVLGGTGIVLLDRVSGRINLILRENYDSVVAMVGLNEALERIDSAFTTALLGEGKQARTSYEQNWQAYESHLADELKNITILPREQELADELARLTKRYHDAGNEFFRGKLSQPQRVRAYLGKEGLQEQFGRLKTIA